MCSQWRRQESSSRGGGSNRRRGKPITNQSPYRRLWGPRSPLPSNLSPENHFELDLLRASLKAALMCALKSRRSRASPRTNTSSTTTTSCGWAEGESWAGAGQELVLPSSTAACLPGKMPKQSPKVSGNLLCGAVG